MNLSFFQASPISIFTQPPLPVLSSAPTQESIQSRTTEKEHTKRVIKSAANPSPDIYWSNVLNLPMSLMDERENPRAEAVQTRNQVTRKKQLYWWM
jgi:hypothetical protein